MAQTQPRQNYHAECEAGVNKQIYLELYASYVYLSMAWYFDRDDVALPGVHEYFKHKATEEREHAEKLMAYQNLRGGRIVLQTTKKPEKDEWGTILESMQTAMELEKNVNQSLLDLHKLAESHRDPYMCSFLEREFLDEQVKDMKDLSDKVSQLRLVGHGMGEFLFDKEAFESH
ncbi:hypothetical protein NP493_1229g00049 [Ridgeia piscesae]|uniref:Ferritin n=1 Tax=Ridgeia piscesae TaxID=27915 RepID=A0AAD9KC42_RIDPI|nr:hypothetical protein NP493_1229g00049 [Ridgeia piscesae]